MEIAVVEEIIFMGKQKIPWNDVEQYLKKYVGQVYIVSKSRDRIHIGGGFPDEYSESAYTKKLRGGLAKAKANAAQVIGKMIEIADNKRWVENKDPKHRKEASRGWYRYDTRFSVPVQGSEEKGKRQNVFRATLVVRSSDHGLYLYDVINIKKEASTPL